MITTCQACGSSATEVFFAIDHVPVSSCFLTTEPGTASGIERGDLRLAVCRECGFIQNEMFQPELIDYTLPYEESQAFSPRFVAFQRELIDRLVADHDLSGKTILEIGAGKGAFLESICLTAGATGIGIDPAVAYERLDTEADITLIPEFFDETQTHLTGDLVCCRHTLEHIQDVSRFVGLVKKSLEQNPGSVAFFELPDTERILTEGAFWDVYYEHCSYFTRESLSGLFERSGLATVRMERAFDDQYLLAEVEVGRVGRDMKTTEHVRRLVEACRSFGQAAHSEIDKWRQLVAEAAESNETVVLWGAGSKAVGFLSALHADDAIAGVVDINPFKQGSFLPGSGHEILAPESLKELRPDLVIVMNPVYLEEIAGMLASSEVPARAMALGVGQSATSSSAPSTTSDR